MALPRSAPWWLLILLIPVLAWAGVRKHVSDDRWSSDFDPHFRKYAKHYFGPHVDWHWFKAQGIAESNLNPDALSPVGAKGIMQIMPATYAEILEKNPHFSNIDDPRWNIAAGIFYDRMLYRKWKRWHKGMPTSERLPFAFASYNAGLGTVLKAFKRASAKEGEIRRWQQVEAYAPGETRFYVRRIHDLMHLRGDAD